MLSRLFTFFLFAFAMVVITACGDPAIKISQTSTSTSSLHTEISPTATPLPLESTAIIQTKTGTAIPMLTPTIAPTMSGSNPTQFPNPEQYRWQLLVGGLNRPIGVTNAGDGSDRLFVIEQSGKVLVISDHELLAEPFLDITGLVSCCGERGLLGLALHPDYSENGFFFVNYTNLSGDTVISRFEVSNDPDQANPASERKLLVVEQPYANHNGGGIAFGPDGYLYIALGDGGSGGITSQQLPLLN